MVEIDGRRSAAAGRAARAVGAAAFLWRGAEGALLQARPALWIPVLLGVGVALYFAWPSEPDWRFALPLTAAAMGAAYLARNRAALFAVSFALALCLAGFSAGAFRTFAVAAPVLERADVGTLSGTILSREDRADRRIRLLIAPDAFDDLAPLPARVRLSITPGQIAGATPVLAGDRIEVFARLLPPPAPVAPDAFDFARQAWFQRLGATGFALGRAETVPAETLTFGHRLARLRYRIAERVRSQMAEPYGAIAAALVTGDRSGIPDEAAEALRQSGLAHILAISGLHMALFAGALFWGLRAVLAMSPELALRYPIKKWAAVGALLGGLIYLVLSGASVATQRAFLMVALMLLAIWLDRPALTLRNVAIAALVILLLTPEALVGASFQMSFAAVVALIAVYENRRHWFDPGAALAGDVFGTFERLRTYVLALALTSLIAGLATAPFAAFHFNRIALYGLVANLLAMPLMAFFIMPMALLALILMPFGLDWLPLIVMEWGIAGTLAVAEMVASWPGSVAYVKSGPMAALGILTLGGLWLCLSTTPQRRWAFLPIGAGLILWAVARPPDALIDREGNAMAVRNPAGQLVFSPGLSRYTRESWARRDGMDPETERSAPRPACDGDGCVFEGPNGERVALSLTLFGFVEDCEKAELVVASDFLPRALERECTAPLMLDRGDAWFGGAQALWLERDGDVARLTSREARGDRPWVTQR